MPTLSNFVTLGFCLGTSLLLGCASGSPILAGCPNPSLPCANPKVSVIAMSDKDGTLQAAGNAAASKFRDIFGKPVPPTIIVPGGTITPETAAKLKDNGFKTLLPWLSAADRARLRNASILKQIEDQTKNLPESLRTSARQQALAQLKSSADSKPKSEQLAALSHELSHMWFIAAFKENGETTKGHAYGGWAPDWLDETAAVLLENFELKEKRRTHFFKLGANDQFPLTEFLTMEHPAAKTAKTLKNANSNETTQENKNSNAGASLRVLTGEEAQAFIKASGGERTVNFYSQVLVFSDYLIERGGGIFIFSDLASSLADGMSFKEWLANNSSGLPNTISGLEEDWKFWLSSTR